MLISLFITCYNDTLFPESGQAVVQVLERLGHQIEFRLAQTCCGQMHANSGYEPEARSLMRRFLANFHDAEIICIPSSSCVAMICDQYPRLAAGNAALEREVSALLPRVFEFTELLTNKLGVEDVGATFAHSVTLHPSCHSLRSLHIEDRPERLLRAVRDLSLIDLPESMECCGFGGTFAIKNVAVSSAMLEDKLESIRQTGAEFCTAVDNSCLMQIAGGLSRHKMPVRTIHIAQILASTGK